LPETELNGIKKTHANIVRRFVRVFREQFPSKDAAAIRFSELPYEFLDDFSQKVGMSVDSIKQIIENVQSTFYIDAQRDTEENPSASSNHISSEGESFESIIGFQVCLMEYFKSVVQKGGIRRKVVFEKINANYIFHIQSEYFDIQGFWNYIDHDYSEFYLTNNYDPNDTTVIFHHWFYPCFNSITDELRNSNEWKSKKASMSATYRKPYDLYMSEVWPGYRDAMRNKRGISS
jgi:hypothetical protein